MTTTYPSRNKRRMVKAHKLYRAGYRFTVDATVTTRKLQALRAIGYSCGRMAEDMGYANRAYLSDLSTGQHARVQTKTARVIDDYYERHHMKPLDDPAARKCIAWAKKAGMAPPAAYDCIDDIDELPKGLRK